MNENQNKDEMEAEEEAILVAAARQFEGGMDASGVMEERGCRVPALMGGDGGGEGSTGHVRPQRLPGGAGGRRDADPVQPVDPGAAGHRVWQDSHLPGQ